MIDNQIPTDDKQMETVEYDSVAFPIALYYDELHRYNNGHINWHWHPHMQFITVKHNSAEIYIDHHKFLLRENEGIWINANRIHMMKCPTGVTEATLQTIIIAPDFIAPKNSLIYQTYIRPFIESAELSYILFSSADDWHRQAVALVTDIFIVWEQAAAGYELEMNYRMSQLWHLIVRHKDDLPRQAQSHGMINAQQRIKLMVAFIHEHYREPLTLEQIAASANISKSECIRCFKRTLNLTPVRYLNQYRLDLSIHLLLSTADPIKEITAGCGFDDASYFNKMFRQYTGMTPTQYRRRSR